MARTSLYGGCPIPGVQVGHLQAAVAFTGDVGAAEGVLALLCCWMLKLQLLPQLLVAHRHQERRAHDAGGTLQPTEKWCHVCLLFTTPSCCRRWPMRAADGAFGLPQPFRPGSRQTLTWNNHVSHATESSAEGCLVCSCQIGGSADRSGLHDGAVRQHRARCKAI
jgi:hypothetical protein